eukprot:11347710-Ditylum_brightwellii.AAC.1
MDDFYGVNESVSENDKSTILESNDSLPNASACLSEGVQATTVIGHAYGLQYFDNVIMEVLPSVVQDLSHENGTGSGMQPKNIIDVSIHPPFDVSTPHTVNTANAQEALYSDADMSIVANKQLISDITRRVRDIAGCTEEFSSNNNSKSGHEQSLIGCSVYSTGTVDEDSTSGDNPNLFPAHQPIINQFLNNNESSYDQGYDSDRNLSFWDPIAAAEDPNTYMEGEVEETSPISPYSDAIETTPAKVQLQTVEAANHLKVAEIKNELWKQGQCVSGNKTESLF